MTRKLRAPSFVLVILALLAFTTEPRLAEAGPPPVPRITRVHISKSARSMQLLGGDVVVATYAVAVGRGGAGPKKREGDLVTPVGHYRVVKHLPSYLRIFLQLDYPNADDRARFDESKKSGALPKEATIGGDIGIHASRPRPSPSRKPITQSHGCVVLEDAEIDQVARMVADGTPVDIED